jgi:hypothetical protein
VSLGIFASSSKIFFVSKSKPSNGTLATKNNPTQQQHEGQSDMVAGEVLCNGISPIFFNLSMVGFVAACVLLIMGWVSSAVISQTKLVQGGRRTAVYAEEETRLVSGHEQRFGGVEQGTDV